MYDKIFERVQINGVELKNRIVMGPMDESLGDNSGNVSSRAMEYFCARSGRDRRYRDLVCGRVPS